MVASDVQKERPYMESRKNNKEEGESMEGKGGKRRWPPGEQISVKRKDFSRCEGNRLQAKRRKKISKGGVNHPLQGERKEG